MLQIYKDLDLAIPEGIEVKIDSRIVTVKGPRGELTKVGIVDWRWEGCMRRGVSFDNGR